VQIVALGRGFAISAEGQALAPGLEGQPVRIRTESGRVVVAVPVAQRRVELTL
jgi:flagella basal body P-ring formation protein FlgA